MTKNVNRKFTNSFVNRCDYRGVSTSKLQEEEIMDAKYNKLMDNTFFRVTLIAVGFAAWLFVSVGLLVVAA